MGDDGMVVNVGHLMAYVDEQREEGNQAYKAGKLTEALNAWQRALDGIGQAEGKPMAKSDVPIVLRARSILHSNRGQALMSKEFWRRAIKDLDEAVRIDSLNAKAIWRRYRAHRALKQWAEAEADLDLLTEPEVQFAAASLLADAKMTAEKLTETKAELQGLRLEAERVAEETFEERMEDVAHKGIEAQREAFEEVTMRTGLHGNRGLADELSEMLTRPGGVTASFVAAVYGIEEEDAETIIEWVRKACIMQGALTGQAV